MIPAPSLSADLSAVGPAEEESQVKVESATSL